MYANVVVDISSEKLDRPFLYLIPPHMETEVKIGMRVQIPFGRGNRQIAGYVIDMTEKTEYDKDKIKSILSVINDEETVETRLIALAAWMRERYGSTMIQALRTVLPIQEKMKAKEQRKITLLISPEAARRLADDLDKKSRKARARILRALAEHKTIDYTYAAKELGTTANVLKPLLEEGKIRVENREIFRNPIDSRTPQEAISVLGQEQQQVLEGIIKEWEQPNPKPCYIQGVTGSGKTQVYMELIAETLKRGKQVIVLIPEIALTYQNVRRFYGRFGDCVSVINSRLSKGERYDQFKRAKQGEVQIMIGPRSALFTPFSKLGLIIMDEEHEPTYKSENSPRYHAREAAIQRASVENARVVMGSATPSIHSYYQGEQGNYRFFHLTKRYQNRQMAKVEVIDLREELKRGNRSILSVRLQEAMEERLEKKEQIILFLNRRGYAGFVSCRSCGAVMKCPHCDVSLASHNHGKLVCHYCGYETPEVKTCPVCGSPYIGGFKAGTQQIEQIVKKRFPESRILRMDYDTTRQKDSHEKILEAFAGYEADILIGTQMIVKGHDFPKVTLMGILAADLSLNEEDYTCAERTFQLLTQAIGRSGRGEQPGEAILQTYQPDHYSIEAAAAQDYQTFYQEEIGYRTLLSYPPAAHMMAIYGSAADEVQLEAAMEYIKKYIQLVNHDKNLHIIGPADARVRKVKDVYRKVMYLKHSQEEVMIHVKDEIDKYIQINTGFQKVMIQYDMHE